VRIDFTFTTIGCLCPLTASVWPGSLESAVDLPFGCLAFPVFCLCCLGLVVAWLLLLVRRPHTPNRRPWGWALATSAIVAGSVWALWFQTPRAIVFANDCTELQPLIPNARDEWRGQPLGQRIGPYTVDRYAADSRGGVFFRTARGPDGIGPDELSYGFANQPNTSGTPFGNSSYSLHHLFGDWYTFSVSDD